MAYVTELIGSGWHGVVAAHRQEKNGLMRPSGRSAWTQVAAGVAAGIFAAGLTSKRRSAGRLAAGATAGAAVGVGAAMAWASRAFLQAASRSAMSRVNSTRDAHWLESHPIDYA